MPGYITAKVTNNSHSKKQDQPITSLLNHLQLSEFLGDTI